MKIWKQGDRITVDKLNDLQRKADAYDKIYPEYERLKAAEKKDVKANKSEK